MINFLHSTDPNFSMQLWGQLLPQSKDSLNMLCIVHDDPSKSTYETHGKHNFNTHNGHHLDAKEMYMNIHKPVNHGSQEELKNGTPDQQKITINVAACISYILDTKIY